MEIIFLCVANSARSQIAEGLARAMAPQGVTVQSAGSAPTTVRPESVQVMAEIGIDISTHHAKGLNDVNLDSSSLVVTLCAEEACPALPGDVHRLHWPIPDPASDPEHPDTLEGFRQARSQIQGMLTDLFSQPLSLP
ncbi:MAG: arsenate reductase ArsC [Myxococcota bacterium]|nr:arsenate reductase ArsC [Myxococcota bacterium]